MRQLSLGENCKTHQVNRAFRSWCFFRGIFSWCLSPCLQCLEGVSMPRDSCRTVRYTHVAPRARENCKTHQENRAFRFVPGAFFVVSFPGACLRWSAARRLTVSSNASYHHACIVWRGCQCAGTAAARCATHTWRRERRENCKTHQENRAFRSVPGAFFVVSFPGSCLHAWACAATPKRLMR